VNDDQENGQPAPGVNRLLRVRMQNRGVSKSALSRATGLDERTIQRSLDGETVPQSQNARAIADALDCEPADLWPQQYKDVVSLADGVAPVTVYVSRAHIPVRVWHELFANAASSIDVCVYGGTFLFDVVAGFNRLISEAAARGVRVRFLAGDPGAHAVHQRGMEESIGSSLAGRCALTLDRLSPVAELDGVEIRVHGTPLYASIFRVDDTLVANHHIFGSPASDNPAIVLTRDRDVELWENYRTSFEKIWARARPAQYSNGSEY
jgi:lambda repressor-like predicted transcriptional regulator